MKQIYSGQASVQDAYALPDLAGAIQQVQLQYEDIASKNLQVGLVPVSDILATGNPLLYFKHLLAWSQWVSFLDPH